MHALQLDLDMACKALRLIVALFMYSSMIDDCDGSPSAIHACLHLRHGQQSLRPRPRHGRGVGFHFDREFRME